MPSDHISRSAAKELIKKERQDCIEAGAIGAANTCSTLLAAFDSLPAAEADGRWKTATEWGLEAIRAWMGGPLMAFTTLSREGGREWLRRRGIIDELLDGTAPSPPAAEGAKRPTDEELDRILPWM